MTAPVPFPDPADKEAVRRWMRENSRDVVGRNAPTTPQEFAAVQRDRLHQGLSGSSASAQNNRRKLAIALTGEPTAHHTVRLSTLGPFFTNLQESVSAVAQAVTGRPTSFASIPRDIREATALSAAATFPSSFGVEMYGPVADEEDEGLFPEHIGERRTVLDEAVDTVLDVADLSEGIGRSDELLAEKLVPLGQRAMKHLGALTAGLTDAHVGLRLAWHCEGGQVRRSEWSSGGVQRVRFLCEHSEFAAAETVMLTGWLGAASAFRGKVEIRTDSAEIIKASTDEDLTPHLDRYFNKRVEAEVEVTKVQTAAGRERKIYTVLSLRNLEPQERGRPDQGSWD